MSKRHEDFLRDARDTDLKGVDFSRAERVHDWRNHVPEEVEAVWDELSDESRYVAYLAAAALAAAEEWE